MKIIELILDEENEDGGITAISLVENPAIEENFIALKSEKYELAEVDKEKRQSDELDVYIRMEQNEQNDISNIREDGDDVEY